MHFTEVPIKDEACNNQDQKLESPHEGKIIDRQGYDDEENKAEAVEEHDTLFRSARESCRLRIAWSLSIGMESSC